LESCHLSQQIGFKKLPTKSTEEEEKSVKNNNKGKEKKGTIVLNTYFLFF
jgi:hypothetical protein